MRRTVYILILLGGILLATLSLSVSEAAQASSEYDYDLIIYGTSSSGIGALRLFTIIRGTEFGAAETKVAIISSSRNLETPLANGLNTEDIYLGDNYASGLYKYFRENITDYYRNKGINPKTNGRLSFESEVASSQLWWYINYGSSYWDGPGRRNVAYYSAHLLAADPLTHALTLSVEGEGETIVTGEYMIDASPTIDLSRMLGISYRIGKDETVYNDMAGITPPEPSAENNWITAPQLLAGLPTFSWVKGGGSIIDERWWLYDPHLYDPEMIARSITSWGFAESWSNTVSLIPFGKHELNESWSDFSDPVASYRYVFHREERGQIRTRIIQEVLDEIRFLQSSGYPELNLIRTYPAPYFRGELMISNGLDRLTIDRLGKPETETIAFSFYSYYDCHELQAASQTEIFVAVPYQIIFCQELDWLVVTDGACIDHQAYNSAFRMEPVRMNVGGAAGVAVSLAILLEVSPQEVPYGELKKVLDCFQWQYWLR